MKVTKKIFTVFTVLCCLLVIGTMPAMAFKPLAGDFSDFDPNNQTFPTSGDTIKIGIYEAFSGGMAGSGVLAMAWLGWINTYQALMLPYIAWILPLSLWILVSYFSQIPIELDHAASVDGCSRWQTLYKIIFPVAAPGVFSTFLLAFIFAFNEFMFALMLTTDYKTRTIPVGITLFQGLHGQTPWGNIMAASVITVLPAVFLALVFQRYIIGGLTRGAVKG